MHVIVTFSAVLVQICAVLDSGAVSRLCNRAITSAAILLATWPLINGLMGSDLLMISNHSKTGLSTIYLLITNIKNTNTNIKNNINLANATKKMPYRQNTAFLCNIITKLLWVLTYLASSAFLSLHTAV